MGPPQILVSREVHGGDYARQLLIDLHRKPMRPPQDPAWLPDAAFVKWHHEEVSKALHEHNETCDSQWKSTTSLATTTW